MRRWRRSIELRPVLNADDGTQVLDTCGANAFRIGLSTASVLSNNGLRASLQVVGQDKRIEDLQTPLAITAADITSRIVVSFHGVGAAFRGLLVVMGYFQVGDGPAVPISEDVFRISYQESANEITPRFEKWLDGCLIEGIAQWRRTLV